MKTELDDNFDRQHMVSGSCRLFLLSFLPFHFGWEKKSIKRKNVCTRDTTGLSVTTYKIFLFFFSSRLWKKQELPIQIDMIEKPMKFVWNNFAVFSFLFGWFILINDRHYFSLFFLSSLRLFFFILWFCFVIISFLSCRSRIVTYCF